LQANRYRRQGSNREIVWDFDFALPEGGVGGGESGMRDAGYQMPDESRQ